LISLATALVLLAALGVFFAALAFSFFRSFWAAFVVSVVSTVFAYQAVGYLQVGYLDPFWEIAAVISAVPSALVAGLVGVSVRWWQDRAAEKGQFKS
jgi:hypothetical protein